MKFIITLILFFSFFYCGEKETNHETRYVNAEGGLRMRAEPDLKGQFITTIPEHSTVIVWEEMGEVLNISGKSGKWTRVKFNDHEGWVFGGFLSDRQSLENTARLNPCLTSLENFKNGCMGTSCMDDLSCGEAHFFKNGGTYYFEYCEGGLKGTWTLEEDKIMVNIPAKSYSPYECVGDIDEEKCRNELEEKYRGTSIETNYRIALSGSSQVTADYTTKYTGTFPPDSGIKSNSTETGTLKYDCIVPYNK